MPCSIIIVGVGNAEFDALEELCGENCLLDDKGRVTARDIVKFVTYNDSKSKGDLNE